MKTIGASKFKEHCLSLLDEVDSQGLIITKNGKPVAKLLPFEPDLKSSIGKFKGKIRVHGDTLSTGLKWNAES